MQDPNLESLRNLFYSSVVYLINEIQPHTLGDGIPYLPEINTGRAFSHLLLYAIIGYPTDKRN